ncbi:hypothetical protein PG984_006774 [Apiospora sp. TS-2023a]
MLHKIEESIAAWGYASCFALAGLEAYYYYFRRPEYRSPEALERWTRKQKIPEPQRRAYLEDVKFIRSQAPLSRWRLGAFGLGHSLPFFALVWLVKGIVQDREDGKFDKKRGPALLGER